MSHLRSVSQPMPSQSRARSRSPTRPNPKLDELPKPMPRLQHALSRPDTNGASPLPEPRVQSSVRPSPLASRVQEPGKPSEMVPRPRRTGASAVMMEGPGSASRSGSTASYVPQLAGGAAATSPAPQTALAFSPASEAATAPGNAGGSDPASANAARSPVAVPAVGTSATRRALRY